MAVDGRHQGPWVLRAVGAGLAAALLGVGIGTSQYLALPGTEILDWSSMPWVILSYAGLCGVLGGLGIGGGMVLALGSGGRPSALRSIGGAALGGLVGCMAPTVVGIIGFGSIPAPYLGTANIVFCILVASSAFVSLWAPRFVDRPRVALVPRIGLATLASTITLGALGLVGWSLAAALGLIPTFEQIQFVAWQLGLVNLGVLLGLATSTAVGATMGLATWVFVSLERRLERR